MCKAAHPVLTKLDHDCMTNLLSATSFSVERLPWLLIVARGRPNKKSNSSPDFRGDQLGDLSKGFRTENLYLQRNYFELCIFTVLECGKAQSLNGYLSRK